MEIPTSWHDILYSCYGRGERRYTDAIKYAAFVDTLHIDRFVMFNCALWFRPKMCTVHICHILLNFLSCIRNLLIGRYWIRWLTFYEYIYALSIESSSDLSNNLTKHYVPYPTLSCSLSHSVVFLKSCHIMQNMTKATRLSHGLSGPKNQVGGHISQIRTLSLSIK